jgi:site-specific DNA-cytosine methylase
MKFKHKETGEIRECDPVMIDAALVSAQHRKRLFWVGYKKNDKYVKILIPLPKDQNILLKDILEPDVDLKYYVNLKEKYKQKDLVKLEGKSKSLSTTCWKGCGNDGVSLIEKKEIDNFKTIQTLSEKIIDISPVNVKNLINSKGKTHQQELLQHAEGKCRTIPAGTHGSTPHLLKTIVPDGYVRRLTPIECERLQSLSEYKKEIIFNIWSNLLNNYVNVENVKNEEKQENIIPSVLIYCEEKQIKVYDNQEKLLGILNVENQYSPVQIKNIIYSLIAINSIVEQIINREEQKQYNKNNFLITQKNKKLIVNLFGKEMKQLVDDAIKNTIIHNKLLKNIILNPSIQEVNEQNVQILFSYVLSFIDKFIPKEIKNQNLLNVKIVINNGYTFGVSDTQRYKCLGNAFNVSVIAHILTFLKKDIK